MATKDKYGMLILSHCTFTRAGLEGVVEDISASQFISVGNLSEALRILLEYSWLNVLILHVTALVSDEDWCHFDLVFSQRALPCHIVLLYEPTLASLLAKLPKLTTKSKRIVNSAVSRLELIAYLEEVGKGHSRNSEGVIE